jgi:hypothetical protein
MNITIFIILKIILNSLDSSFYFLYSNQMYGFSSITIIFFKNLLMMMIVMMIIIICYFTLQIKSIIVF